MMKCDFCEKYRMDNTGNFKCFSMFPEDYCTKAIERMTATIKNIGSVETRQKESEEAYIKNDQESLDTLLKSYLFGR